MDPLVTAAAKVAVRRVRLRHQLMSWDDAMQEALLGAWMADQRVQADRSHAERWVYLVSRAEGALRDALRTLRRLDGVRRDGTTPTDDIPVPAAVEVDEGSDPLGELIVRRAIQAIEKMSARERLIAERSAAGASLAELAGEFGMSESRLSQIKSAMRRRLRKHL